MVEVNRPDKVSQSLQALWAESSTTIYMAQPYFHIQPRYVWITHHGCAVCGAVQQVPKNYL